MMPDKNFPTVMQIWERFGTNKSKIRAHVFGKGDTTSAAEGGQRMVTTVAGDLAVDVILTPCTADCQHHLDEAIPEDTARLFIRSDGRVEILRKEKGDGADTTKVELFSVQTGPELTPEMLASLPDPTQLCEGCEMFDFGFLFDGILSSDEDTDEIGVATLAWAALELPKDRRQDFHKTFSELRESAKRCAACAVVLAALPDPEGFVADDDRLIVLRPNAKRDAKGNRSVSNVEAGFPELDPLHPGAHVTRFGVIDVISDYDTLATTWPLGVRGRPVPAAADPTLALRWMRECADNHETCRFAISTRVMPTRVIRVPHDEGLDPWLEDGNGMAEDYVALSYRWGSANMSKTLTSNLTQHHKAIPLSKLSRTIRDAIEVTRRLRYSYLWVDSLCIIQDSSDDWKHEASRMADVYENAALTISASASNSADSGLFFQQNPVYLVPVTAKSIGGKPYSPFALALRNCSSFASDVQTGPLSSRGWCLQERVLSRRILHFGTSQTHWECLGAVWSADYSRLDDFDDRPVSIRKAFQTILRRSKPKPGPKLVHDLPLESDTSKGWVYWKGTDEEFVKMKPPPGPMSQLYGLEPHGTWYKMLLDYSRRELTFPSDKLAALSGLASSFARKTGDIYLNGLWLHGLPEGLLWSSVGLCRGTYESTSWSSRPPIKRAPSWSWASLDGPVVYALTKYSYVDASVHAYSVPGNPPPKAPRPNNSGPTDGDLNKGITGTNPSQRLILKGRIRTLASLEGFKPDQREHLRETADSRSAMFVPHAIFDDPNRSYDDLDGVYALFIAQVGCGNKDCVHESDCGAGFAHCLLVERREDATPDGKREETVWERVGVAQCFSWDVGRGLKVFVTLV